MGLIGAAFFVVFIIAIMVWANRENILYGWTVSEWMSPKPSGPVTIVVRTEEGKENVYLKYNGKREQIGTLKHELGSDFPLMTMFVEINANRFVVTMPDKSIRADMNGVIYYTLDPDFPNEPEKSRKARSVIADRNSLAIVPLGPNHAPGWETIAKILITPKDIDRPSVRKVFDPPLEVDSFFKSIEVPTD